MTYTKATFEMVAQQIRARIDLMPTVLEEALMSEEDALRIVSKRETLVSLAGSFSREFSASNPRFSSARFMDACGL